MCDPAVIETGNCAPFDIDIGHHKGSLDDEYAQVVPASSDTYMLSRPISATPTKIRGVDFPDEPDVESNVTQVIPILSLLIPLLSDGSGA